VQAYKLIAAGTVEEKIQALQARKRELFQASLGGDEAFVESLTGDEPVEEGSSQVFIERITPDSAR
jgi:SNF2 family DNA or RNA helicase